MIYAKHIRFVVSVCILITLSFFSGCSKDKIPVPSSAKPSRMPVSRPLPKTVPKIINQARILSEQGDVQDALLFYNHAFDLTQRTVAGQDVVFKTTILDDVEALLSQMDPLKIQKFSRIINLSLPQDLFDYWAGYQFAQNQDYANAVNALNAFLETYPDHPKTGQVRQSLAGLGDASFDKKKLGVILPMTGKYKLYGQKAMKGIELALARLSESGIKDLSIVVKDSMADSVQAAMCVDQLGKENVFAILGPIFVSKQTADNAQALGIPMMALTQKIQFPQYGDYIFSNFITPEMQVQALGNYIFHELGLTRVAVLYPGDKYGNRYMQAFSKMVQQFEGHLTASQAYDGGKTDFSTSIKRLIRTRYTMPEVQDQSSHTASAYQPTSSESAIKIRRNSRLSFQALFIPDSVSKINMILPQLVYHDARGIALLGTNLWHRDSLLKQTRKYNRNTIICDGYFPGSANPETAWFAKKFQDLYQKKAGFLEAIAYDTTQILFTAANAGDVYSGGQLKEVLREQFIFDGATGRTRFDKTGAPQKELFLITIKDNQFMEINR